MLRTALYNISQRIRLWRGVTGFEYFPDLPGHRREIVKAIGRFSTPLYVIDAGIVSARYLEAAGALNAYWPGPSAIAYSYKTNYDLVQTGIIRKLGGWAEVVSAWEYRMARSQNIPGPHIIFNGPVKTDDAIAAALSAGAAVHIDNVSELHRFLHVSRRIARPVHIGLRVTCSNPYLNRSRFGFVLDDGEAYRAFTRLASAPGVAVSSIHMHIGSDVDMPEAYSYAAAKLAVFLRSLPRPQLRRISMLDIGGGFPAHGGRPLASPRWFPRPVAEYVRAAVRPLLPLFTAGRHPRLVIEPGRFLIDDAECLLTRVWDVKRRGGQRTLLVDAGAPMLPLGKYRMQSVRPYTASMEEIKGFSRFTVVHGATCKEDDQVFNGFLPDAAVGTLLCFYAVGAYNSSMGSEFIIGKPPVAVIGDVVQNTARSGVAKKARK